VAATGVAVIAELKKASPSKGLIRADFHAGHLAHELEEGGAAALSVLTSRIFFAARSKTCGWRRKTRVCRACAKTSLWRKAQIIEARANQADAVLLIVAALEQTELVRLACKSSRAAARRLMRGHTTRKSCSARSMPDAI